MHIGNFNSKDFKISLKQLLTIFSFSSYYINQKVIKYASNGAKFSKAKKVFSLSTSSSLSNFIQYFFISAQTVFDMQHQKQLGTSPDDKILACCLFVKEKYESVVSLIKAFNNARCTNCF